MLAWTINVLCDNEYERSCSEHALRKLTEWNKASTICSEVGEESNE